MKQNKAAKAQKATRIAHSLKRAVQIAQEMGGQIALVSSRPTGLVYWITK